MKLEGVGIVSPYPRLNLDPLWRQWELYICKEAHRRTIKKLEVDGKVSKKAFRQWYIDWLFGDESYSDSYTEGGHSIQENASDLAGKDTSAKKSEGWGNRFYVEERIWRCGVCMALNQKGGTD